MNSRSLIDTARFTIPIFETEKSWVQFTIVFLLPAQCGLNLQAPLFILLHAA